MWARAYACCRCCRQQQPDAHQVAIPPHAPRPVGELQQLSRVQPAPTATPAPAATAPATKRAPRRCRRWYERRSGQGRRGRRQPPVVGVRFRQHAAATPTAAATETRRGATAATLRQRDAGGRAPRQEPPQVSRRGRHLDHRRHHCRRRYVSQVLQVGVAHRRETAGAPKPSQVGVHEPPAP